MSVNKVEVSRYVELETEEREKNIAALLLLADLHKKGLINDAVFNKIKLEYGDRIDIATV